MEIKELFAKKIDRKIEEVIKVDQHNEQVVLNEMEEYIVTEAIRDHFVTVYDEIAKSPSDPREGIGVWVSGFFGSGKSSFAKILGYTVGNRGLGNKSATGVFKENVKDQKVSSLLDNINARIPTEAVIFDVSMERGVRTVSDRITEIMYKAFLRQLDYSDDLDLADLEITLEGDGKLVDFTELFEKLHQKPWKTRRKLALALNEASAVLTKMDPATYPTADSYASSLGKGRADITPNLLAERAFELAARRLPGKALIFIIDEVGQYVARSVDKMLDLQAVVQAFGREGLNRVQRREATSPFWIVVTSQEKLNEVVDALDSKKIELARLQDRFRIMIDLKQSDIQEVTGRRILAKDDSRKKILERLYEANEGRLKTLCVLERTSRNTSIEKKEFVNLYPYLPYQIELSIDIVAGLRLKRGAHRHIGGSNRTMIKQAQQMMIHPRTQVGSAPVGTLVTLDRLYELLYEGNLLPTEVTREVDTVPEHVPGDEMAHKVAKAISLLESVNDLPRTQHNIAVALHPAVEADSILQDVERALKALDQAKVIRDSEEGYKLLTVQEKQWDVTRSGCEPREADRNRIKREVLKEIFSDARVRNYRYKELRSFKCSLVVDGTAVDMGGEFLLNILIADTQLETDDRCREAREQSNAKQQEIFWVTSFPEEIRHLVDENYRSREMISTHERIAAQGKLSPEEASCLSEEKRRRDGFQRNLRTKITSALQAGTGLFNGVQRDGSALGQNLQEVVHKLFDYVVPDLYPKLEMGVRPLKGDEAEKFLTAANLSGLSSVFYSDQNGLNLVVKQADKYVPNINADICKEVLEYINREHAYGNKVTGKSVEAHFQGIGYGWERDILRVVLAVLLRGGFIEVTHQGRKYRNHHDPACRLPFTSNPAFRAASFAPREALGLKLLTKAARHYEEMTGKEVDIEESAIAQAFQKLAAQDREEILPLVAKMGALNLPGTGSIKDHLQSVEGIIEMPADDCVKTLAGEGLSYQQARARVAKLIEATTDENLNLLRQGRAVMRDLWPVLETRGQAEDLQKKAQECSAALASEQFYEQIEAIRLASDAVSKRYAGLYTNLHDHRRALYTEALDYVKGLPEWNIISQDNNVTNEDRSRLLSLILARADHELDLPDKALVCRICKASVAQLETDNTVAEAIRDQVIKEIQTFVAPEERIERVRVSQVLKGTLENEKDIDEAIERLKEYLLKLIASGVKIILE